MWILRMLMTACVDLILVEAMARTRGAVSDGSYVKGAFDEALDLPCNVCTLQGFPDLHRRCQLAAMRQMI
jgi:hypothetical protein